MDHQTKFDFITNRIDEYEEATLLHIESIERHRNGGELPMDKQRRFKELLDNMRNRKALREREKDKADRYDKRIVVIMRRPVLPEDEDCHFFIAERPYDEARKWIEDQAGGYFKPGDYYLQEKVK